MEPPPPTLPMPDAVPAAGRSPKAHDPAPPGARVLAGLASTAIVIAGLYFCQSVLIPLTLAVIVSFVLAPVVDLLKRFHLPRVPAAILAVLAALGVLGSLGMLIGTQAASLAANADQYAATIEKKFDSLRFTLDEHIAKLTAEFTPSRERRSAGTLPRPAGVAGQSSATSGAQPVPVRMVDGNTSPLTIVRAIVQPALGPLETVFLVLIVAVFILVQKEDLRDRFIYVVGAGNPAATEQALDDAGTRLSKYLLSELVINTTFAIVIALGLWIIGLPSPAMWGVLAGLLRFVPYVGSVLSALIAAALGAAIEPGWTIAIQVLLLFVVVEPLTGYVIEPLVYGHSTGLSPIAVIVAAIFWTWLWGPIGLIMSTPLTLCLVVIGRHVRGLNVFVTMLGDEPVPRAGRVESRS